MQTVSSKASRSFPDLRYCWVISKCCFAKHVRSCFTASVILFCTNQQVQQKDFECLFKKRKKKCFVKTLLFCCSHHHTHFNYVGHIGMVYQKKSLTGREVIVARQHSLHPAGCILKQSMNASPALPVTGKNKDVWGVFLSLVFPFALLLRCSCCRNWKKTQQVDGWCAMLGRAKHSKMKQLKGLKWR